MEDYIHVRIVAAGKVRSWVGIHTFFNAVLFGSFVIRIFFLGCYSFDALVVVVLKSYAHS